MTQFSFHHLFGGASEDGLNCRTEFKKKTAVNSIFNYVPEIH